MFALMATPVILTVTLLLGGSELKVQVDDPDFKRAERDPGVVFWTLQSRVSQSLVTTERLENGLPVVVNWGHVQAIVLPDARFGRK